MKTFNNACWSLGLIAISGTEYAPSSFLRTGDSAALIQTYLSRILFPLVTAIQQLTKLDDIDAIVVKQNLAISFCRMGIVCPKEVAIALPEILEKLLKAILLIEPSNDPGGEFAHTWTGLLCLLHANPQALLESSRAGTAFLELCLSQVSVELDYDEFNQLTSQGMQPWLVAPSLIVSSPLIKGGIASILSSLQQQQPETFKKGMDTSKQYLLEAFK